MQWRNQSMEILHSIGTRKNYAKIVSNCIQIEIHLSLLAMQIVEMLDMVWNEIGNRPTKLPFRSESFVSSYHHCAECCMDHVQVNKIKCRHEATTTENRWKVERFHRFSFWLERMRDVSRFQWMSYDLWILYMMSQCSVCVYFWIWNFLAPTSSSTKTAKLVDKLVLRCIFDHKIIERNSWTYHIHIRESNEQCF